MQPRPDKLDLLRGVEFFLSDTAIPNLQARDQFLARVALNAVRMVLRELETEEKVLIEEHAQLRELFDNRHRSKFQSLSAIREEIRQMNLKLGELIRTGQFDDAPKRAQLIDALKRSTLHKLDVNDPKLAARIRDEWSSTPNQTP